MLMGMLCCVMGMEQAGVLEPEADGRVEASYVPEKPFASLSVLEK